MHSSEESLVGWTQSLGLTGEAQMRRGCVKFMIFFLKTFPLH